MNRSRWVLAVAAVLLLFNIGWIIYSRWGLITIHANAKPLSEVVRSIAQQGGVVLRTDLEPNTPVTMNVVRVPLADALETLAAVTDSRWRLAYVTARNRGEVTAALGTFAAGQKADGWKTLYVPLPPMVGDADLTPPDPRRDTWNVHDPAEKTLQAYLDQGSRNVSAEFMFPTDWNPPVTVGPASGPVRQVAPQLAKLAGGSQQEVFLLVKSRRPAEVVAGADDNAREWMGNSEARAERIQVAMAKATPEQRAELEQWQQLAGLPPEQRRAKMEELTQQPKVQDMMEQRQLDREARLTPDQRLDRAQSYAQRRQDMRSSGGTQ